MRVPRHSFFCCNVLFASGGTVQTMDDAARAAIERTAKHDAHHVMIFPFGCNDETCTAMGSFWNELAAAAPLDVLWRIHCDEDSASVMCAQVPVSHKREALVVSWTGQEWQLYSGPKSVQVLAGHVAQKINAAMTRVPAEAPPPPAAAAPEECIMHAFRAPSHQRAAEVGQPPLTPNDVSRQTVFTAFVRNGSVELPGGTQGVAHGEMRWPSSMGTVSHFDVLPGVVRPGEVAQILELVSASNEERLPFDTDPDSVDGMASHEMFVYTSEMYTGTNPSETYKGGDGDPMQREARRPVREQLERLMSPIIESRITPFVRNRFPAVCDGKPSRRCTPCSSLVRRYLPGERRTHSTHYDSEALVSVVVSLSHFGDEYTGGLYLAAGSSAGRQVLPLLRGDAVVHQSDLLHGVEVESGERWSWILWYRDSTTCDEHGHEWFAACAIEGNPICQGLHATKVNKVPGISGGEHARQMLEWHMQAAEGGMAQSIIKLARAFQKRLPSALPFEPDTAARLYQRGIELWDDPDCYYGLAQTLLQNQTQADGEGPVRHALRLFEAAAKEGHRFAAYNLGVAHMHGHGTPRDGGLAAEWFAYSGLPEGLYLVAQYHRAHGRTLEAARWLERAKTLGHGAPWREKAREHTGTGGAGGVSLHSAWPVDAACENMWGGVSQSNRVSVGR